MYTLMTPGPTMVPGNVRLARSLVVGNPDIDPDFYDFYRDTLPPHERPAPHKR